MVTTSLAHVDVDAKVDVKGDMDAGADADEKPTMSSGQDTPSAFYRLPNEIIEQILRLTDPNSFASLVLLDSKWRRVSQQASLYAYHLSRCESYAGSHNAVPVASVDSDSLPELRRLFAREAKRNLFEAYLRPKKTTIKLVSNCISSSSAPGGEGMQFSPSPRGHHLLAYNSSRIYVLDVRGRELAVRRQLKILRRPVSACILDDASLLAVLSTDMQIDLYDLGQVPPRRKQSLVLDYAPRTIALSPCGSVLAAAYEGGIEVSSISPGALPTDRRAVKCDGVDALAFSFDGTQLLGTTTTSHTPNTVILTAPYYDPGNQMSDDNISALWTTSILFPNTSRDCSHAVLLQESNSIEATWTFTYDRSFETFRAVRIDDLRNGTTYFTGPIPTASSPVPLLPCTLPAANYEGELVSAGFEGSDIWLYGVPEDLEAVPEGNQSMSDSNAPPTLHRRGSGLSVRSPSRVQEANGARVPQWQILCDKFRNTFVSGRMICQLPGTSTVKWVSGFGNTSLEERLIIAARGVLPPKPITEEDGIDFVDGGRITILDFDYSLENGKERDITIEVGTQEPEVLEEERRDMDTEVAIVRRRTVAQRRGDRGGVMRAATSAARQADALLRPSTSHRNEDLEDPLVPRPMVTARAGSSVVAPEEVETASLEEAQEALDAPYAHANPRSGTTLRRAATAAAANRQRNPQPAVAGPVEYRRADGRAEHPHESDADNWVPPPPPYSKEDPGDLPAFLRHSVVPGVGLANQAVPPVPPVPPIPPVPQLPRGLSTSPSGRPELPRLRTSTSGERISRMTWNPYTPRQRVASEFTTANAPVGRRSQRPISSPPLPQNGQTSRVEDDEDLYDVSPVGSPEPEISHTPQIRTVSSTTLERPSPYHQSAGTQSSATEFTPASSRSYHTTDGSRPGSASPYVIDPTAPPPISNAPVWSDRQPGASPAVNRLPNAQTWPRAPPGSNSDSLAALTGYPRSAPASNLRNDEIIAAVLPPAPRADQLDSLYRRRDGSGASRPASGSFQLSRVPVGSRDSHVHGSRRYSGIPEVRSPPVPDQPLIISTPTGVTGALDVPDSSAMHRNPAEPVLHAPVPRHPRPMSRTSLLRPAAEALEPISSIPSGGEARNNPAFVVSPGLPSSQLTPSPLRHHTSLTRRQSRARRGALKNIQDARLRGWTGRRKKKNKNADAASNADWTEVTRPSTAPRGYGKEKKCIVM
ncbi:hypothetical protein F4779DRAFT_563604 [Xylariaceae sp. FL0662B]|nr:hypothetical protein F4779DRAFT_563604 [Xylariaceae sp. FL0662B]